MPLDSDNTFVHWGDVSGSIQGRHAQVGPMCGEAKETGDTVALISSDSQP